MQYKIGPPIITGREIVGYEVVNTINNEVKKLRLSDIVVLANKNQINADAVKDDNGVWHIAINGEKASPEKETYTIESRVMQGDKLSYYRCRQVGTGEIKKLKPFKLWELASQGLVTNAESKVIGKRLAIIGKGQDLKELPVIKL